MAGSHMSKSHRAPLYVTQIGRNWLTWTQLTYNYTFRFFSFVFSMKQPVFASRGDYLLCIFAGHSFTES